MSRNLQQINCDRCDGDVCLTGPVRPGTAADFGRYVPQYNGMLVADAECTDCGTPYLAWVDERTRTSPLYHDHDRWVRDSGDFVDLSYRNSFNDEPAPDGSDDPKYAVVRVRVPVAAASRWDEVPDGVCKHGRASCAACAVHKGRAIPSTVMP